MNIKEVNQICFEFLIKLQAEDPTLFFVPRMTNTNSRLDDGYFFIGNDDYMQISFWKGADWKQKLHYIGFTIKSDGKVYYELSGTDESKYDDFLRNLAKHLSKRTNRDYENPREGKYFFYLNKDAYINEEKENDTFYLQYLEDFIKKEKPIIDGYIKLHRDECDWIEFPNEDFDAKYVQPLRQKFKQSLQDAPLESFIKEGKSKEVYTTYYERSPKNRKMAIDHCRKENGGKLVCNICGFVFEDHYGEIGKDFIEVHHIKPICENKGNPKGIDPTVDLICVCSNCHRMLHKLKVAPTAENLKKEIAKVKTVK